MLGTAKPKGKIVVLDGEGLHAGIGIAEKLARVGNDVHYLSPMFSPVGPRVNTGLETPLIMKRMREAGVKMSQSEYITEIGERAVTITDVWSDATRVIADVDAVVLATGRVPQNQIEKALTGKVDQLFVVGDALSARMWAASTHEGHKFARLIGEPGAPRSFSEIYFEAN